MYVQLCRSKVKDKNLGFSIEPHVLWERSCPLHISRTVMISKLYFTCILTNTRECVIMYVQLCRSKVKVKYLGFGIEPHVLWERSCPLHILRTIMISKFILNMYINQHKSCVIMFVQICRSTVKVKNLDFIMEPHDLWERSCPLHTLRTIRISLYLTCLLSNNFVGQRSR